MTFEDGKITSGYEGYGRKINEQSKYCTKVKELEQIIQIALLNDQTFINVVCPFDHEKLRISKTQEGGRYGLHHDSHLLGDYSTTVFLSDMDEYDGGELVVKPHNQSAEWIKLPSGFAVTYPSDYPHLVNEVTDGTRLVALNWTRSKFKDPSIRRLYANISSAVNELPMWGEDILTDSDSPRYRLRESLNLLDRQFSREYDRKQ